VFDWTKDACEPRDIPDLPARAFRDARGQVQLIATHYVNRRDAGPDLGSVRHRCEVVLASDYDPLPENFNDHEWLASTYTLDGRTVFGLVHDEYQGNTHPGHCPSGEYLRCWYNTITFARSLDGGRTYQQPDGPRKLIAAIPYRYEPGSGANGIFNPSNIVYRESDRHYYFVARSGAYGVQQAGACLFRTPTLADPKTWRAWDGSGFTVRTVDPYRDNASPADHVCQPVAFPQISSMSSSLTWNTYIGQYLLVGQAGGLVGNATATFGIYYSTSPDLINWSPRKALRIVPAPWTYVCGGRPPVAYPSLLDPTSTSRNFETTGQRPWLYLTRSHYSGCTQTLNRDLVRVPLELSK
jgi:hypothetical protein